MKCECPETWFKHEYLVCCMANNGKIVAWWRSVAYYGGPKMPSNYEWLIQNTYTENDHETDIS